MRQIIIQIDIFVAGILSFQFVFECGQFELINPGFHTLDEVFTKLERATALNFNQDYDDVEERGTNVTGHRLITRIQSFHVRGHIEEMGLVYLCFTPDVICQKSGDLRLVNTLNELVFPGKPTSSMDAASLYRRRLISLLLLPNDDLYHHVNGYERESQFAQAACNTADGTHDSRKL